MSNDIQKADQIAHRLFTKLTLVVNQARVTAESTSSSSGSSSRSQAKVDKWFNLETPDSDIFRDHLRIYRTVSSPLPPSPSQPTHRPQPPPSSPHLPPFELQVLLSIPELTNNQVLVYQTGTGTDSSSPRVRIEPTPRFVLLESWVLVFNPSPTPSSSSASAASSSSGGYHYGEGDSASTSASSSTTTSTGGGAAGEVAPSTIYKHGITLFRSLFSLLRILPAWKLFKRLRRGNRSAGLGIRLRVRGIEGDHIHEHAILGFETPPTRTHPPLPTTTHTFSPIPHPMGTLTLTARYLTTPNFHLDEMESVLSSRFLEEGLEGGPEFTPTLAGRGRGMGAGMGIGTSPLGSLPIRTSLPMSPPPPQPSSIADRFILHGPASLHARAASLPPRRVSPSNSTSPASTSSHSNSNVVPVTRTTSTSSATAYPPTAAATTTTTTTNTFAAPHITTTSAGTGQGTGAATPGTPGSGSGISGGSSSRGHEATTWSRDDASGFGGKQVSGIAARLRRESTGAGRGADLPSSPGPLPIRRPNINPVHPFKASTLSSGSPSLHSPSPSLRQPSPLSSAGGPSLPSRPFPSTSVAGGAGATTSPTTTTCRVPPSPIGMASRPSPPQPPIAPSSLGDRRSLASAEGASGSGGGDESPSPKMQGLGLAQAQGPGKKRYSSSFSKRYSVTGGSGSGVGGGGGTGSEGSVGSGVEKKDGERVGSAGGGSFLSTNTDDDDISVFVQEIDARKPLSGHQRIRSLEQETSDTGRGLGGSGSSRVSRDEKPIAGLLSTDEQGASTSTGPMLTSESEVDERLRQMNQVFLESLEGLGGGRRRERRSSSRLGGGDGGSEQSSEPDPPLGRMSTESSGSKDGGGAVMGRGRGQTLPPRPPLNPRSTSTSDVGSMQGSDEVLGRLSLDGGRRRSHGH